MMIDIVRTSRSTAVLVVLAAFVSACAQPLGGSTIAKATAPGSERIEYHLPRTVVLLDAEVTRTWKKRRCEKTWTDGTWSILDTRFSTRSERDPDRKFTIDLPKKERWHVLTGTYTLESNGVLTSSSSTSDENVSSGVLSGIEAATKVVAAAVSLAFAGGDTCQSKESQRTARQNDLDLRIKEIGRLLQMSGAKPADFSMIDARIKEIAVLDAELIEETHVQRGKLRCEFTPDASAMDITLTAAADGKIVSGTKGGPLSCMASEFEVPENATGATTTWNISVPAAPTITSCETSSMLYYLDPITAEVRLEESGKLLAISDVPMPQHSSVRCLPDRKFFKRSKVAITAELHGQTGTLKKLDVTLGKDASGAAKRVADSAANVATAAVDAEKKRRDEADAELAREVDDLKLQQCKDALLAGTWTSACEY